MVWTKKPTTHSYNDEVILQHLIHENEMIWWSHESNDILFIWEYRMELGIKKTKRKKINNNIYMNREIKDQPNKN